MAGTRAWAGHAEVQIGLPRKTQNVQGQAEVAHLEVQESPMLTQAALSMTPLVSLSSVQVLLQNRWAHCAVLVVLYSTLR